jgi:hypothetical protein
MFSVREKTPGIGWRVSRHVAGIVLSDVRYVVSRSGLERAKKTGQKNVHAWLEGDVVEENMLLIDLRGRSVRYTVDVGRFWFMSPPGILVDIAASPRAICWTHETTRWKPMVIAP